MTDLISKLEAATEGSRKLDWAIACDSRINKYDDAVVNPPHYTTSIDAALTLVPEGWGVAGLWEAAKPKDRPWWGCDLRRDEPYKLDRTLGAKTAALALCIAALKAR